MASIIKTTYYPTSYGELIIGSLENKLCLCDWRHRKQRDRIDKRIKEGLAGTYEIGGSEVIQQAVKQLDEYFNKKRTRFDIPLLLVGTDFQKKVWNELLKIEFGETRSYLELTKKITEPTAIRAVASANGANAISIIIPCHRIIGNQGDLVGYAGGITSKKKLLLLEGGLDSDQLSLFSNQ